MKKRWRKIGVLALSVPLGLVAAEALLYIHALVDVNERMIYLPNSAHGSNPNPEHVPGVSGRAVIRGNSWGLRGPMPARDSIYGVVFGSSTSECLWLDDSESWPLQLMKAFKECGTTDGKVVINIAGRRGMVTRHSVIQLETLVQQRRPIDFAALMPGGADFMMWLTHERYSGLRKKDEMRAFVNAVQLWSPYPKRRKDLLLDQYRRRMKDRVKTGFRRVFLPSSASGERDGSTYIEARKFYRDAEKTDTLPADKIQPFEDALRDFRKQIGDFLDLCEQHSIKPVLVTQPMMYRPKMPAEYLRRYMWRTGPNSVIPTPDLYHTILARYAAAVREVCAERGVVVADLFDHPDLGLDCFYDRVHFNEKGAAKAGRIIQQVLATAPPFSRERDATEKGDGK